MLFILYSCHQDDNNSHEGHSHDTEYKMVNKPFEYFKNLPALLKTTIPKNHKSFFKSKDSIDVYNFAIDSSVVSEITKGTEKFYTMAIYRNGKTPDIDVFENLVVCDRDSVQEAFIVTYFPNTEYDDRLKNNIHAPFIGGGKCH